MTAKKIPFVLNHPFQFGEEIVTELSLREPTAKDMYDFKGQDFESMFKFACNCADEVPKKLEKMHAKDAVRFVAVVSDFLADGQETGAI